MAHQLKNHTRKPLHTLFPRYNVIFLLISSLFIWASTTHASAEPNIESTRLAPPLKQQSKLSKKNKSAEALYVLSKTTVKDDGHWEKRSYTSIRVNDADAARDYGRIVIPYNHYYSDIELEFANTVSADGKVIALSEDALQTRITGGGQDFYSDSSEIVFSLPDISPGSILEFQVKAKSKHLALAELYSERSSPYWVQSTVANDGWRADYVHNYQNTITTPNNRPLHYKTFSDFTANPKKTSTSTSTTFNWKMTSINGIKSETWMPLPREFMPSLHISTLNDWSAIDRWSWEKIEDKLSDPTIESVASSLMLDKNA